MDIFSCGYSAWVVKWHYIWCTLELVCTHDLLGDLYEKKIVWA